MGGAKLAAPDRRLCPALIFIRAPGFPDTEKLSGELYYYLGLFKTRANMHLMGKPAPPLSRPHRHFPLGRRRTACLLSLLTWSVLMLVTVCWLGQRAGRALLPPPPPDQNLNHFRRSRELQHYLDNIDLLIEPSSVCESDTPVLALVSSAPAHVAQRQAVRDSWGKHLPTYFVLGLAETELDNTLADNYVEAKQHSDLIVFEMPDHYQNLTLKTMLMLQWAVQRCSHAEHLLKTDDDVLVNPWTLQTLLEQHPDAKLLGYRILESSLHRDEYSKWFVPRWLRPHDRVPEYLSGTGYVLRGENLEEILTAAKKVPLINLEDVYLTYLVSKSKLDLELVHDRRLSPFRPWLPSDCAYWALASTHSLKPSEITHAWAKIEKIEKGYRSDSGICGFYKKYFDSDVFLY